MKISVPIAILSCGLLSCSPSQDPNQERTPPDKTDSGTSKSFSNATKYRARVDPADRFTATRFVDSEILSGDRLKFSYGQIDDSGVILERISLEGESKWKAEVSPLGVPHSEYYHTVDVSIDGTKNEAIVTSAGVQSIIERIDLRNGRQISREINENER